MTGTFDGVVQLRSFDLAAGETLTIDARRIGYPFGWVASATGADMTVEGSNAETPGPDDWLASTGEPSVAAGTTVSGSEDTPVGWMRWRCAATGTGKVEFAYRGTLDGEVS